MENNLQIQNSISNLSFLWMAEFTDETIFQLQNGVEHRYQEVKDRINKLKYFTLQHKEKDLNFSVDLTLGIITFNKNYQAEEIKEEKHNIRLIYFKRNTITMTESGQEQKHTITYHLGLQWNDNLGNNRQVVLKIDSEGNWILGE